MTSHRMWFWCDHIGVTALVTTALVVGKKRYQRHIADRVVKEIVIGEKCKQNEGIHSDQMIEQGRKLGRCDSFLRNLKLSMTD